MLKGPEVKSLRHGRATLTEAWAGEREGELFLFNCYIPEYQGGVLSPVRAARAAQAAAEAEADRRADRRGHARRADAGAAATSTSTTAAWPRCCSASPRAAEGGQAPGDRRAATGSATRRGSDARSRCKSLVMISRDHLLEHRLGQHAGVRVVARDMVGVGEQQAVRQRDDLAVAELNAGDGISKARRTAACATTPSARTTRSAGSACSSAARNRLQVRISIGSGKLAGGTHRTAFTIRVASAAAVIGGRRRAAAARPNFSKRLV